MASPAISPERQRERNITKRKLTAAQVRTAQEVKTRMATLISSLDEAIVMAAGRPDLVKHLQFIQDQARGIVALQETMIANSSTQAAILDKEQREAGPVPFRRPGKPWRPGPESPDAS